MLTDNLLTSSVGTKEQNVAITRFAKTRGYTVLENLGQGSMGSLFLVRGHADGKLFALKTPQSVYEPKHQTDAVSQIAFHNEVRVGASLAHPNIVKIRDYHLKGPLPFAVMDYIPGRKTLKYYRHPERLLPVKEVLKIVADCAMALGYVHSRGIVHRDIKPSNILITADLKVKITDFGVAQFSPHAHRPTLVIAGTPKYMSPEQIAQKPLNGQSDLFSLGVVLYELLVGSHPFVADTLNRLNENILHSQLPSWNGKFGCIDAALTQVLERVLAKDQKDRYQSAYAFASDLLLLHDKLVRRERLSQRCAA